MKNSKAPSHLRKETRAWWTDVHIHWRLEEHHSRLLTMACTAWDRAEEAGEILARDGIVIGGRQAAVRPHPAIAIERDSRLAFARLVAQLNLDGEPPSEIDANVRAARRSNRPGGWKASNGQTQQQYSKEQN
jgi:P27 family predicted phage terminase small subunit